MKNTDFPSYKKAANGFPIRRFLVERFSEELFCQRTGKELEKNEKYAIII